MNAVLFSRFVKRPRLTDWTKMSTPGWTCGPIKQDGPRTPAMFCRKPPIVKNPPAMPPPCGRSGEDRWGLKYVSGDLFSCPEDEALAHCISEDCHMGAGIAVMFRQKFKGVEELKRQRKVTGQCAVLKRDKRHVYYLITKEKYRNKPTYESLRQSLEDMKTYCRRNGVTRVSMPRIGCGLDRLQWDKVSVILEQVFKYSGISITVYSLPCKAKTPTSTSCVKHAPIEQDKPQPWKIFAKKQDAMPPPSAQSKEDRWGLKYVSGDLFSCPEDEALAHCISEDCHMGAGIAVMFKQKFKGVEELKRQRKVTGQCAVLKRDKRHVYYLITKEKYRNKPTYESLRQSLEDMKTHCRRNGVTRVSMPRIGCGLDRLQWDKVSVILEQVFKYSGISITVYSLPCKAETL